MSNIEIYESDDGSVRLGVQLEDETVWLRLDQMALLFGRDKSTISRHKKMFLTRVNYRRSQLLQKMQQLGLTVKLIK